ncbi:MAG: hypothetical protein Salg2KO_17800 [Salibacteraceae bacterium]
MKSILIILSIMAVSSASIAQGKYFTRDGHIKFFSSTTMEDIEADNHKVTMVIDESTGKMEISALVKSFEFEKALMQEHFNENYMESTTYPKATFKGTVKDFKKGAYNTPTEVIAAGDLTRHGVTKAVEIPGTIAVKDGAYRLESKFLVKPADYDIVIPNTVSDKIANEIEVMVDADLNPLKK